jgi:hypothetical protein
MRGTTQVAVPANGKVAGYQSWDRSHQRPFKRTIRFKPTWVPQKTVADAPRFRVKTIIESEQDRIAAVKAAMLLPKDFLINKLAEHPINVLTLSAADRKLLLEGPKISIIADGNVIIRKGVAIRALMASCQKVHNLLHVKPRVTQFRVFGNVNVKCIKTLLDIFTTPALLDLQHPNFITDSFDQNVLIYQASLTLGIHYTHTAPFLNSLRDTISSRLLTTSELDTIVRRIPSPTNPLFKHLANDLCHRHFKKQIPDAAKFEQWLGCKGKAGLKKVMMEIDTKHPRHRQAVARQAVAKRQCEWKSAKVLETLGEDVDGVAAEKSSEGDMVEIKGGEVVEGEVRVTPTMRGRWGKLGVSV